MVTDHNNSIQITHSCKHGWTLRGWEKLRVVTIPNAPKTSNKSILLLVSRLGWLLPLWNKVKKAEKQMVMSSAVSVPISILKTNIKTINSSSLDGDMTTFYLGIDKSCLSCYWPNYQHYGQPLEGGDSLNGIICYNRVGRRVVRGGGPLGFVLLLAWT